MMYRITPHYRYSGPYAVESGIRQCGPVAGAAGARNAMGNVHLVRLADDPWCLWGGAEGRCGGYRDGVRGRVARRREGEGRVQGLGVGVGRGGGRGVAGAHASGDGDVDPETARWWRPADRRRTGWASGAGGRVRARRP